MYKKFEINRTKIKGGCQSGRKMVTHNSKSELPLQAHWPGIPVFESKLCVILCVQPGSHFDAYLIEICYTNMVFMSFWDLDPHQGIMMMK